MNASMFGTTYAKAKAEAMTRFPNNPRKARRFVEEMIGILSKEGLDELHAEGNRASAYMTKCHRRLLEGNAVSRLFWRIYYFF